MSANKDLKTKEKTLDSNTLTSEMVDKRKKLEEIASSIALYMLQQHPREKAAEISVLKDRLHFRTLVAENALLDEKIDIYSQVLKVLKR